MDILDEIYEELGQYGELYDFVAYKYWSEYWPENYINKRDVDNETPEELVISLLEYGELERFGYKE